MELSACDIQAIVNDWLKEIRAEQEAEADSYFGKRSEPRWHPWCESMEVRMDDEVVLARGENLSARGVGFVCKREIPPGALVHMRRVGESTWIPVRIRHSTQTVGAYKVGAKFVKA